MIRRPTAITIALITFAAASLSACSDDPDDGDLETFCRLANDKARYAAVFDSFDPLDTAEAHDTLVDASAALLALLEVAPPAVRDDLQVLLTAVADIDEAVLAADPDDPASLEDALDGVRGREAQIEAANTALESLRKEQCKTE